MKNLKKLTRNELKMLAGGNGLQPVGFTDDSNCPPLAGCAYGGVSIWINGKESRNCCPEPIKHLG